MKAIEKILRKPHEGKEPHKKVILRAMVQGERVTSYWGFQNGIVRLTNRVNEMINEGIPIQMDKHRAGKTHWSSYRLPKAYLS